MRIKIDVRAVGLVEIPRLLTEFPDSIDSTATPICKRIRRITGGAEVEGGSRGVGDGLRAE
ncbi:hypothetical protein [Natrinema halophilum]|uniref:Uncharacterized protein n=1 Tax=Natrinema halophilum TaxID=1699371 RepID=A0A7D5L3D7_9EURY|nr:hypothetical protein [Natrinema halophilum]QLG49185.1 hypothetical protein HYG82_10115 [Natrinema halophilum]